MVIKGRIFRCLFVGFSALSPVFSALFVDWFAVLALLFAVASTCGSSRLDILTSCTEFLSHFLHRILFREKSSIVFLFKIPCLKEAVSTELKCHTTFGTRHFSCISAFASHLIALSLASWSKRRMMVISRDILERESFFVC